MLCRLCAYECFREDAVSIFGDDDEDLYIAKLVLKYLHLEISESDTFSTQICEKCFWILKDFDVFYKNIEERQEVLRSLESQKEIITCDIKTENFENEGLGELLTEKLEPTEFHYNTCHDEEPLVEFSELLPEMIQPLELNHTACEERLSNTNSCNESDQNEDDLPLLDLKTKASNRKLGKIAKISLKKHDKQGRSQKSYKKKIKNNTEIIDKKSKKPAKNKRSPEEEKKKDAQVAKFVSLKCEICEEVADTYKNFQLHFNRQHKQKAYIVCCGKRLNKRSLILEHVQFHVNPELYKCEICNKVLKTRTSLLGHIQIYHKDRAQLKQACELCGKKFAYLSMLKQHMEVHSAERNFTCDICQKRFKNDIGLKFHMKQMHSERTLHICDVCGKEYRFKNSFERHVAEHQGKLEELKKQCPICKTWVSANYLRRHIQRHEKVDVNCDLCGQLFHSRAVLQSHKDRKHRNRKIYTCHICDKTFIRSSTFKEHVDLHTGHKEHSCKYCPREFRSKANMYAHTKKVHHEQWKQAQLIRFQDPNKTENPMEHIKQTKETF